MTASVLTAVSTTPKDITSTTAATTTASTAKLQDSTTKARADNKTSKPTIKGKKRKSTTPKKSYYRVINMSGYANDPPREYYFETTDGLKSVVLWILNQAQPFLEYDNANIEDDVDIEKEIKKEKEAEVLLQSIHLVDVANCDGNLYRRNINKRNELYKQLIELIGTDRVKDMIDTSFSGAAEQESHANTWRIEDWQKPSFVCLPPLQ